MASNRIVLAIVTSLALVSCDKPSPASPSMIAEAPPIAEPAPTTGPTPSATLPSMPKGPGFVRLEGSRVVLSDGLVTLQIPGGWQTIEGTHEQLEIEAARHVKNPDRWARCRVRVLALPNLRDLSQEAANEDYGHRSSPSIERMRAEGVLIDHTTSDHVGDVVIDRTTLNQGGAYVDIRQLPIVHGAFLVAIQMDCDAALPLTPEDKRDIDAFLGSAKINRPT